MSPTASISLIAFLVILFILSLNKQFRNTITYLITVSIPVWYSKQKGKLAGRKKLKELTSTYKLIIDGYEQSLRLLNNKLLKLKSELYESMISCHRAKSLEIRTSINLLSHQVDEYLEKVNSYSGESALKKFFQKQAQKATTLLNKHILKATKKGYVYNKECQSEEIEALKKEIENCEIKKSEIERNIVSLIEEQGKAIEIECNKSIEAQKIEIDNLNNIIKTLKEKIEEDGETIPKSQPLRKQFFALFAPFAKAFSNLWSKDAVEKNDESSSLYLIPKNIKEIFVGVGFFILLLTYIYLDASILFTGVKLSLGEFGKQGSAFLEEFSDLLEAAVRVFVPAFSFNIELSEILAVTSSLFALFCVSFIDHLAKKYKWQPNHWIWPLLFIIILTFLRSLIGYGYFGKGISTISTNFFFSLLWGASTWGLGMLDSATSAFKLMIGSFASIMSFITKCVLTLLLTLVIFLLLLISIPAAGLLILLTILLLILNAIVGVEKNAPLQKVTSPTVVNLHDIKKLHIEILKTIAYHRGYRLGLTGVYSWSKFKEVKNNNI